MIHRSSPRLSVSVVVLWSLCCMGLPSSTDPPPPAGPLDLDTKVPVRETRRWMLPGMRTDVPAPPEAGITSGQCGDLTDGGPVGGPDCITDTISCGETVIGHTRGGANQFDTAFWEQKFCWPATVDHSGGDERVYLLEMPQGAWRAFVTLDTPCADLDLMAVKHSGKVCPSHGTNVNQCESMLKAGRGKREVVELAHQGQASWLLVVEGSDQHEGAFALHVQCREGIH